MPTKLISCGALLYAFNMKGEIGVILGKECGMYFPLKGCQEPNETLAETAIREVHEESCGLVKLDTIDLDCMLSTGRKQYHIGLAEVSIDIIDKFKERRLHEQRGSFMEIDELRFFKLDDIDANLNACRELGKDVVKRLSDSPRKALGDMFDIHYITKHIIEFYRSKLKGKQLMRMIRQPISSQQSVNKPICKQVSQQSEPVSCRLAYQLEIKQLEISTRQKINQLINMLADFNITI